MTFLFLNNIVTEIDPISEFIVIKNALILGEQTFSISYHSVHIYLLIHTKMSDKKAIELFARYFVNDPNVTQEGADHFYATLTNLRNRKNKTKQELVILGGMEKSMKNIHLDVNRYYLLFCEHYKVTCLKEFAANNDLRIFPFINADNVSADELFPVVLDTLTTNERMSYFDESILKYAKEVEFNDTEIAFLDYNEPIILSLPLFVIPGLDTLNYNQLKMIRTELNATMNAIDTALKAFEDEINLLRFDAKNIVTIIEKAEQIIVPLCSNLKGKVEGNMYFLQIKNSIENPPLSTVKIGISSVRTMIHLLSARHIISAIDHDVITERASNIISLDSCKIFMYHSLENKPAMMLLQ